MVYLSNEIWAVGTMSNASPQTPHPSAENNPSQKIKVEGKVKIGYMPRINKGLRAELQLFYWLGIGAWMRDWVIYHWSNKRICHRKVGITASAAATQVTESPFEWEMMHSSATADYSSAWTSRCPRLFNLVRRLSHHPVVPHNTLNLD